MTAKPECVSDLLRDLYRGLNAELAEKGHIHLDRAMSSRLVMSVGKIADHARNLENAWSCAEWNRRAFEDRLKLISSMNAITAEVLQLMRPDIEDGGNVVQFRPRPSNAPAPSAPSGGDAA